MEKIHPAKASIYISKIYAIKGDVENSIKWLKIHLNSEYKIEKSLIRLDEDFLNISNSSEWDNIWLEDWYSDYELSLESADYYVKRDEFVDAIFEYDKIIADYPDIADTYTKRANAYMQIKDYKSSIRDLSSAIKTDDTNYKYYYDRGLMYDNLKKISYPILTHIINYDANQNRRIIIYQKNIHKSKIFQNVSKNIDI